MAGRAPALLGLFAALRAAGAVRYGIPKFAGDTTAMSFQAATDLIEELDENRDKKIDAKEVLKAAARVGGEPPSVADDPHTVEMLLRRFAAADLDGDGGLDALEVEEFVGQFPASALLRAAAGAGDDGAEAAPLSEEDNDEGADAIADLFRALDTDADGKIEKREMLEAVLAESDDDPAFADHIERLFEWADADHDGSLDFKEAEQFLELLGEHVYGDSQDAAEPGHADEGVVDHTAGGLADIFQELDTNVDGKIQREELAHAAASAHSPHGSETELLLQHFASADRNEDGALDDVEVKEFIGHFPASALHRALAEEGVMNAEVSSAEGQRDEGGDALADMFRALDANADGKIEKRDMLAAALEEGDADANFEQLVEELFELADLDQDGCLDRQEAETFLELLGEHISKEERSMEGVEDEGSLAVAASQITDELDLDEDGQIGREEIAHVVAGRIGGDEDPEVLEALMQRFAAADADGDGRLDGLEVEEFIGTFPAGALLRATADDEADASEPAKGGRVDDDGQGDGDDDDDDGITDVFRALDVDGDGLIERREMLAAVLEEGGDDAGLPKLAEELFAKADADGDGSLDLREARVFLELLAEHM